MAIQRSSWNSILGFSWKDVGFMTIILISLNLVDMVSSFYAVGVLGFTELNPFAAGFPFWSMFLKFSVCFIPLVCAYVLHRFGMENYLLLPFVCSVVLIEFYAFVVAFNLGNILGF